MVATGRRLQVLLVAVLAASALLLGACGSASEPSPPTGVDGLVVPTPSVDPADFGSAIDNPWLPLRPGATWTYHVTGASAPGGVGTMTVTVDPGTTRVDGVPATAVRTRIVGVSASSEQVDYYAQDRAGNVWWLGREGQWQAGKDGAEAGLAMPAQPRYGDGWREAYLPGVVEDRAEVVKVDDEFSVSGTHYTGILDLDASSDRAPGVTRRRSYVAGIGLVRSYAVDGSADLLELTSGP